MLLAKGLQAEIAQLVEHNLAKVGVAGSSPVFRSLFFFVCLVDNKHHYYFTLRKLKSYS